MELIRIFKIKINSKIFFSHLESIIFTSQNHCKHHV